MTEFRTHILGKLELNLRRAWRLEMRRSRPPSPEPQEVSPPPGGTRGGALDATELVKAQAVVLFYKGLVDGMKRMAAYDYSARSTNNSVESVRTWVRLENDHGMEALVSRRDSNGPVTRFSPKKKARIDEIMVDTNGEPTLRHVQAALGLGSAHTAKTYIRLAGWKKAVKRLKTLLSPAHMQARLEYVEKHYEDEL
jgi:hypothetical protein